MTPCLTACGLSELPCTRVAWEGVLPLLSPIVSETDIPIVSETDIFLNGGVLAVDLHLLAYTHQFSVFYCEIGVVVKRIVSENFTDQAEQ